MANTAGLDAKEIAELKAVCADPKSINRDVKAAEQKLADTKKGK